VTLNLEKSDGLVHCSVKNATVLWFGTFAMLFSATGVLFVMKTLEDEW